MAHGERQGHAPIRQAHLYIASHVEIAVPQMYVTVANARGCDTQQNLGPCGLRCFYFPFLQRFAPIRDLIGFHSVLLNLLPPTYASSTDRSSSVEAKS